MPKAQERQYTPEAAAIHAKRRENFRQRMRDAVTLRHDHPLTHSWRKRRWLIILLVNGLLVLGFRLEWNVLQGTLSTSRLFGLTLSEPFATLQIFLATHTLSSDVLVGALVVSGFYILIGGRVFCAWICPYTLLAELGEMLHFHLRKKQWIREHTFPANTRYWMTGLFALLAAVSGYAVFENISTMAILSRALVYGSGAALAWVGLVLLFEIFYSRRAWCRYLCPIGVVYRLLGVLSPIRVHYSIQACHHDGACRKACPVLGGLEITKAGHAPRLLNRLSDSCTSCGRCIDVCPTHSLKFVIAPPWPRPFFLARDAHAPQTGSRPGPAPCQRPTEGGGGESEAAGGSSTTGAGTKRSIS
ncbi:MAG: NapH/MauN family ferredoxin-type protein [Magnetococcales bacterium]|nr:NapH/MauN family ferredoxin-type protein [Magnetococcales bacterium]